MNKILYLLITISVFSCSKKDDSTTLPTLPVDGDITVDEIRLSPYRFGRGYDTTSNYIAEHGFTLRSQTQAYYVATTNPPDQKYYLKYVGAAPLLSPDSVIWNTGEAMMFPINNSLKGQIIFEVYNTTNNTPIRKIRASSDSCKIMASFSVFANYAITVPQIRNAFHYFLTIKQTPAIKYYVIQ